MNTDAKTEIIKETQALVDKLLALRTKENAYAIVEAVKRAQESCFWACYALDSNNTKLDESQ